MRVSARIEKRFKIACNNLVGGCITSHVMKLLLKLNRAKIVRARYRKRWSQTQLAKRCGVSLQTIWKAENEKTLSSTLAEVICKKLEVKEDDVVILIRERKGNAA